MSSRSFTDVPRAALLAVGIGLVAWAAAVEHRVEKGDTLFNISRRYGVTVEDLRRWNNLRDNSIKVGQVLRVAPPSAGRGGGPVRHKMHTVRRGETLWRIAYTHGVSVRELMTLNNIKDVGSLKVGQRIRIPVAERSTERRVGEDSRRVEGGQVPGLAVARPVRGGVEAYKKGVRIYCNEGAAASAVLPGEVEYTGSLVGYRNVVILRHAGEVYSVYAGLGDVTVAAGQAVRQGQVVGRVVRLPHYDRSFLYFELVVGGRNVDPVRHFRD